MIPNYQPMQNMNNTVICSIEDNAIIQVGSYGNPPKKIGITLNKYEELLSLLDQYRNKLIELGVIEKEKTPEELQKENQALLSAILKRLDNLEKEKEDEHKEFDTARTELFSEGKRKDNKRS